MKTIASASTAKKAKQRRDSATMRELRRMAAEAGLTPRLYWLTEDQGRELADFLGAKKWACNSPRQALGALGRKPPEKDAQQVAEVPASKKVARKSETNTRGGDKSQLSLFEDAASTTTGGAR